MRRLMIFVLVCVFGFGGLAGAQTEVLGFEEHYSGGTRTGSIAVGYGGFEWNSIARWVHRKHAVGSGYDQGAIGDVVMFNSVQQEIVLSRIGGEEIDFLGAYITGAWHSEQEFRVEGWRDGELVESFDGVTTYEGPVWFDLDFVNVDELRISTGDSGGINLSGGSGAFLAIDQLTYVVPEPGSLGLVVLGALGVMRRRA